MRVVPNEAGPSQLFFKRVHVGARHLASAPEGVQKIDKTRSTEGRLSMLDYRHQEPYALHRDIHETSLRQDGDTSVTRRTLSLYRVRT